MRYVVGFALSLFVLGVVNPAAARQEYYDAISAGTGTCADCRLCHKGPVGQATTWDPSKPLLDGLLRDSRVGQLPDPTRDGDKDGATDLVELEQFGDPNDPAVGPGEFECPTGPQPEYGCLRIAPAAPNSGAAAATLGVLGALFLLRRRRFS